MPNGITKGRAMSCCSLALQTPAATGLFNAASDWAACALLPSRGSVMACRKTMRIKDVRQGLHTLVHTQGLDGLLHLYQRLEKWGRALLLCLLCAEAGCRDDVLDDAIDEENLAPDRRSGS